MAGSAPSVVVPSTADTMQSTVHSTLQQPRLKAPSQAPQLQATQVVTPSMAANPTSPPPQRPTSHNGTVGPSSTSPMDTDNNAGEQEDNGDVVMGAQSVCSSHSRSSSKDFSLNGDNRGQ
eukprot:5101422-Amphidinium_carterae.1